MDIENQNLPSTNQTSATPNQPQPQPQPKKKGVSILTILTLVILALAAGLFFYDGNKTKHQSFDQFVSDTPQVIFKSATFSKYVMRGTPAGTADKLNKLVVYQVKATGNYYLDMKKLSVVKVDEANNTIYLKYNKAKGDPRIPVSVDIDITPEDIYEVDQITPQPISEEEAEKIAGTMAIITGGLGAVLGGKLANAVLGNFQLAFWPRVAGTAIGSAAVGGFCAYKGYVMTKNFCLGKTLTSSIDLDDKEDFLLAAKELMAMEMLTLNVENKADEKELIKAYEHEVQSQVAVIMTQLGYDNAVIDFGE